MTGLEEEDEFVVNMLENAISVFRSENKRTLSKEELQGRFVPNILTEKQFERGYEILILSKLSKYSK